jgi:hypothetical protein
LWIHVIPNFSRFLQELELSGEERADAQGKALRIAKCLSCRYYAGEFNPACYIVVGSHGKKTAIRPASDLDMLFLVPSSEYLRLESTIGNRQSYLLQEAKNAMKETFHSTDLRADGQVIEAPFSTYNVDVVPAFAVDDGTYLIPHTANGGSWRRSNPVEEYRIFARADSVSAGKATHLLKMLKAWKRECSVDLKSISLEVLASAFVEQWMFRDQTLYYYDWLVRDFFRFLLSYKNYSTGVPGTTETIQIGDAWFTKCETAYARTLKACEYERLDQGYAAALEWQKIFGAQFSEPSFLEMAMAAAR